MKTKKRHLIILLVLLLGNIGLALAQDPEYIYFDLAAGDITITAGGNYNGYRWVTVSGTTTLENVFGSHNDANQYYIYQSQDTYSSATGSYTTTTGNQDGTIVVPTYDDVYIGEQKWEEYITNNTDVNAVNSNWETTASDTYRTSTTNHIKLNGNAQYNLTIDNLYCNHGTKTDGSIHVVEGNWDAQVNIKLKNTSKLVKVFYNRLKNGSTTYTGYLKFWSSDGDGHTNNGSLTLTVPSTFDNIYSFSLIGSGSDTGSDGDYGPTYRQVAGVYFEGGTIYAGMKNGGVWTGSSSCHCVIGGIGAYGEMYIHGGRLTAVGYTGSAVIGGGGGIKGWFGPAKVEITGGTVYAYNFGTYFNASHNDVTYKGVAPGTAIGGGTSGAGGSGYTWTQSGHAEVTITGGRVYAQCIGGPAIGGGSSFKQHGGNLTVTISGNAHVTAVSKKGTINGQTYNATAAIAGGNSYDESAIQPGKVNLTVGGTATLITGSIDGGVNKSGRRKGRVVATINGGTVQGQFVLHENFYPTTDVNTFTMTGGTIDNTLLPAVGADENPRLYAPGGAIYSNGAKDVINISGGTITHCSATTGGAIYLGAGTLTLSGGTITGNTATTNGGGVYKLGSMMVSGAPIVKGNTAVGKTNNVYIPSAATEPYILYTNGEMGCGAQIGVTKKDTEHTYTALGSSFYTNITKVITETSNAYLPVIPSKVASAQRGEFIIPQDGLSAAMKGKAIKKMTFYLETPASASWGSPSFLCYMVEVDHTTLSKYRTGVASATGDVTTKVNVCDYFALPNHGTTATEYIDFSTNYTYQGGNLFVGFLGRDKGTNKTASFSGIEAPSGSGASGSDASNFNTRDFLPKVTFTYGDADNSLNDNTWTFPDDCYTGIGTACTNHFFFDDTQACQVCSQSYNAALSPFTLYFVKNAEGDNSWLRQAPSAVATGATPDYTLASDGVHVASIHTNTGLAYFASEVLSGMDYAGQTVTLTNDINLSGHNWEPAGFCAACGDAGTTTFAGTFDGQGHSIYNLNSSYDYKNMGLFGHVTGTVKNVVINGSVTSSGATNLGGIAGELDGGAIYNCVSTATLSGTATNKGALVGKVTSGSLLNSFAISNDLVCGTGTATNCYVRKASGGTDSNMGTATNVGASGSTTDVFTETVTPYKYKHNDNKVGSGSGSPSLLAELNAWVDAQSTPADLAQWTRTCASPINGDYPLLKMPGTKCVGTKSGSNDVLTYGDSLNLMLGTHNASGDNIFFWGAEGSTASPVNTGNGSATVYFDEDAALIHTSAITNAYVGITLKDAAWHMFSPAISSAPLGINYNNDATVYNYGTAPTPYAFYSEDDADGYFPSTDFGGSAYYSDYDYYCYYEPEYHWINFKRNSPSHWHEDIDHRNIKYHWDNNPDNALSLGNETTLKPGKGYLLGIKTDTYLQSHGTLNPSDGNSDVTFPVTKWSNWRTGYNLIGNPYQAYLDFNDFADYNSGSGKIWSEASSAFYLMISGGAYHQHAYGASNNQLQAPRCLHPHQGFMVITENNTNAIFQNGMRELSDATSAPFRGEASIDYPLVNLIATDEDGKSDILTVELGRPEVGGAPKAYDLHTGKGCLYVNYEDKDYAIAFTQPGIGEVGVRFAADEEANFTMTWDMENGEFSYVHLIDNMMGIDIDCLNANEYRFTARPSDYKSRFRLVFDYTGIEEPEVSEPVEGPTTFVFQMNNELVVNGEGQLQMFDLTGRLVMSANTYGTQSSVALPEISKGMYVLRINGKNGIKTQKIVIK